MKSEACDARYLKHTLALSTVDGIGKSSEENRGKSRSDGRVYGNQPPDPVWTKDPPPYPRRNCTAYAKLPRDEVSILRFHWASGRLSPTEHTNLGSYTMLTVSCLLVLPRRQILFLSCIKIEFIQQRIASDYIKNRI